MGFAVLAKVSRPFHTFFQRDTENALSTFETGFFLPQTEMNCHDSSMIALPERAIVYGTNFVWSIYHSCRAKVKQIAQFPKKQVKETPDTTCIRRQTV